MKTALLVLLCIVFFFACPGFAQVPRTLSYQGVLTDTLGNPKADGTYSLTFRLYDVSSGGGSIWEEQKTLPLKKGLFHTVLGDQAVIGPSVMFDKRYWLGVQAATDPEMVPRVPLTAVGYSLNSARADTAQYARSAPGSGTLPTSFRDKHLALFYRENGIDSLVYTIRDAVPPNNTEDTVATWRDVRAISKTTGGAITGVTAGAGLAGGGSAGNVVLSLADGGVTNSKIADTSITGSKIRVPLTLFSGNGLAIDAFTVHGTAVRASAGLDGTGLYASSVEGTAIRAEANWEHGDTAIIAHGGYGVVASGYIHPGVLAGSTYGAAVSASSSEGVGVSAYGRYCGITAGYTAYGADTSRAFAGIFHGPVQIDGTLTKAAGAFKIDHPLDPANKFLYHSFVESPEMKNVYDGVVELDARGEATVMLPVYFQALNTDFRYQLTCIGSYAPVYVAEEVANNSFRIAGGKPGQKVSWQITGNRQDAFARAHRIQPEVAKGPGEVGKYLFPVEHGVSAEAGINYEMQKKMEARALEVSKEFGDRGVRGK
jgi:hypothetical protein